MATNSVRFLDLRGKCVVVTGASAGIGEAVAHEFALQGSHLMLCGRDETRLNKVAADCRSKAPEGVKVCITLGDLCDEAVQKAIIDNTISELGKIDVLINNAGMIMPCNYNCSRENYHRLMAVNLDSVFFLTQKVVPHLEKTQGSIVNVSSILSEQPVPNVMVYSMTKAAMDAFTRSLAVDLAPKGIRVNSVNPGSVETMIYRDMLDLKSEQYQKFKAAMSSPDIHPLGRMAETSEVADAIVFLACPRRASFLTGQILFVDGGRRCVAPKPNVK